MSDRFIICRASAGAGKTYALVRQFIETAISTPSDLEHRFERILAITFTNKAANGMKQRIMRQLRQIVNNDDSSLDLVDEMAKDLGVDSNEVRCRCGVLQSSILHHYSNLSVCTIDSFVHRLVHTFAHDLNLPMNFNVQIDEQDVLQWSVDSLLAAAGREGEDSLTGMLCKFVESRMEDGAGYDLETKLIKLAGQILKEETPRYLSKLGAMKLEDFIQAYVTLTARNKEYEGKLKEAAEGFINACQEKGLGMDDFPYRDKGIYPFFARFSQGDFSTINNEHKRVDTAAQKGVLYAQKTAELIKTKIEEVTPAYLSSYQKISTLLDEGLSQYNSRKLLLTNLFGMALLGRFNEYKNDYYRENETVHISEFNKRIAQEVANEPAPFIYERIGSRYANYMIDEFQDTSRLQWLNFLPLLDEALSHQPSANTALPGLQSLVVGDGKQAIYRFRQGDVRQFMKLPSVDDPIHGSSLQYNAKEVNLDRNFRTMSNIVEFNNRFFTHIITHQFADNEELRNLYLGSGGESSPSLLQKPVKEGGYVAVRFCQSDEMLQNIHEAIQYQVDNKGYSYGDILVLARDNKTLSNVADYLTDNAIPVVSAESFILGNSRVVQLLYSLLEYIFNTEEKVAAADVVQGMINLGMLPDNNGEEPLWTLRKVGFNLVEFLKKYEIEFDVEFLRGLSLYDCCEEILRRFRLGGVDTAYVSSFLNVVNSFQQRNHSGLRGLLDYLKAKLGKLSCSMVNDMDAVQLMTIHKAKGLEAKVVIYAMPEERFHGSQMWVEVPQEEDLPLPVAFVNKRNVSSCFDAVFEEEDRLGEMDRINILYVGMTRAEDKLIVVCEDKQSKEGKDNASLLRDFLKSDKQSMSMDDMLYTLGDDVEKVMSDNEKEDVERLMVDSVVFQPWQKRIDIAVKNESQLVPVMEDSRREGIMFHDILSRVIRSEDLEEVVKNYCHTNGLDDKIEQTVLSRLSEMMRKDNNRRFFDGTCRVNCEVSMVVNGEVLRPDRVVFGNDATWVVDYKTGVYDEKSHKRYEAQVGKYCAAISAMGYPNVKPVIIYL